jgi:hypothetical protein
MVRKTTIANDKIVVLAAYLAGGAQRLVDTEDIAIKANDLAPGRFSWRKYPDQINIESVRKRLYDAAKASKGGLISGGEKEGWLLTSEGLHFCSKNEKLFAEGLEYSPRLSAKERTWQTRERSRLLNETAYTKWKKGETDIITLQEAEKFFAIDDYIKGEVRKNRLQRTSKVFRGDKDLEDAIAAIAQLVGE